MKTLWKKIRRHGFTLVELLVVITIIGLIAALLLPAINSALISAQLTATLANGNQMYKSMMAREAETATSPYTKSAFDATTNFTTSTDFFIWCVTDQVMNVAYNFFSAKGVPPVTDESMFKQGEGAYNAWCFVRDSRDIPDTAPLLFLRNIKSTGTGEKLSPTPFKIDSTARPFGDKASGLLFRGGAAQAILKDDIRKNTWTNYWVIVVPGSSPASNLVNEVLRPGAQF